MSEVQDMYHTSLEQRLKRSVSALHPLSQEDVNVYYRAGQDFEHMKDALKLEYQMYCVAQAQKARYKTKNQGW